MHAFVVARAGATPDAERSRAPVAAQRGEGAVPVTVTTVTAVPTTAGDEPDKRALLAGLTG